MCLALGLLKQHDDKTVPKAVKAETRRFPAGCVRRGDASADPSWAADPGEGGPRRAVPRRAPLRLPRSGGMSGQDRVTANARSLTPGAVSSRLSLLWSSPESRHLPLLRAQGAGSAGWARAIVQRHPQPSRAQANVLAASASTWIDATKVISVSGDACQRGRTAAGTEVV